MAFDPITQTVQVRPTSKLGSAIETVKLWIDEAILGSIDSLFVLKFVDVVHHNFSDMIVPHLSPNIRPLFEMSLSDDPSISGIHFLKFDNNTTLSHLTGSSREWCNASSTKRYVAISLDLRLLSDSLYHIGDHSILMSAWLHMPNKRYSFFTILNLRVEAGLINHDVSHAHFLSHANLHACFFNEMHTLYWIL